jgi:hypothetical protein
MSSLSSLAQMGNPYSQQHQDAFYRASYIETEYFESLGTELLPVAKPGNSPGKILPAVIVQTCSPFGWKVVSFFFGRIAVPPTIPDPEPDNDNQVLKLTRIKFINPQPEPSSENMFYVEGNYYYMLRQPITVKNGTFHIGLQPVLQEQIYTGINSSQFSNLTPTGGSENPG